MNSTGLKYKFRKYLWKILGIDYSQTLRVHDNIFLNRDKHIFIGNKTYDNGALVWRWTDAKIIIGNYCSIANGVNFIVDEGFHQASNITSYPIVNTLFKKDKELPNNINKQDFLNKINQRKGIKIGHDVWIGMGSYIMPGVTIGNGVTIASNSVVTKNIPDYSVVAGVPAKIIKEKHTPETIKKLNVIAWWNWTDEEVKNRALDFYIETKEFVDKYYKP